MKKLTDICNITTGKLDSNACEVNGKYPFFTCAPLPLKINSFAFDDDVILLAGNNASGNFHCQRFCGKFNAYQRTYIITEKDGYDLDYIFYNLKMQLKILESKSSGSQTKFLTMKILENIMIKDLSLESQKKKVIALKEIDQQIQRNKDMVHKLQVLAQATYSRWFNQFEFPNNNEKLVFNEQLDKVIPESWSVLSLSDCVSLNMRGISQVEDPYKQIVPVINQKCIRDGNILMSEVYWHHNDNCLSTYQLSFMDVLINSMGTGTLGRISPFIIDKTCVPHSCVTVLRVNDSTMISKAYLYLTIKQMEQKITSMGTGSTGQTSLNNSELGKIKLVVPSIDIQSNFELCVLPLFEQLQRINMENINLFSLKKTILPLLINGQLNI